MMPGTTNQKLLIVSATVLVLVAFVTIDLVGAVNEGSPLIILAAFFAIIVSGIATVSAVMCIRNSTRK